MKNTNFFTLLLFISAILPVAALSQCPNSHISISSQSDINNFSTTYPGCTELLQGMNIIETTPGNIVNLNGLSVLTKIEKDLTIRANTNLNDFTGLNNITEIVEGFVIKNNTSLTNFSGLTSLTTVGRMEFVDNPALSSLSGLSNLQTSTDAAGVTFRNNDALTSFSGLNSLASMLGPLAIDGNNLLSSLNGLNSLTSIGGNIVIVFNSSLTTLSGLNNLNSICGGVSCDPSSTLFLASNQSLSDISALSNLTSINGGSILIDDSNLSSLSGLENIDHTTINSISVTNNTSLSTCAVQGLCEFIDANPANRYDFSGNASGCNNDTEVETACAALLPIELIEFKSKVLNTDIVLNWVTAAEENNSHFEIEQGFDGITFNSIGKVLGNGTSSRQNYYQFVDNDPISGTNYYRLKQIDFDGRFDYSKILSIQINNNKQSELLKIIPNPNNGQFQIQFDNSKEKPFYLQLFNQWFGNFFKEKATKKESIILRECDFIQIMLPTKTRFLSKRY